MTFPSGRAVKPNICTDARVSMPLVSRLVFYLTPGEEKGGGGVWRCTPVKACSKRLHTISHTDARTHTETRRGRKNKKIKSFSHAESRRWGDLQRHIGRSPGICSCSSSSSSRSLRRHTAAKRDTGPRLQPRLHVLISHWWAARADFVESERNTRAFLMIFT